MFPPWETRIGGYTINNIVYSGVVLPTLIFAPLFAVPWIDRFLTGDSSEHHLLDRPRDAANRTAIGVGSITAVTVLFLGGAQDVIANTLEMPVATVTRALQVLFLIAPPIAFWLARRSCLALQRRPGPDHTEREGEIVRTADGGYHTIEETAGRDGPAGDHETVDA